LILTPAGDGSAEVIDSQYFGHYRSLRLRHTSGLLLQAKVWAQNDLRIGDHVHLQIQCDVVAFPSVQQSA
jgi:hypothetical protein